MKPKGKIKTIVIHVPYALKLSFKDRRRVLPYAHIVTMPLLLCDLFEWQ